MARKIILLSGKIGSGKTTLSDSFASQFQVFLLKTKNLIKEIAEKDSQGDLVKRGLLQDYGDKLDRKTKGRWVCDNLRKLEASLQDDAVIAVDAVRKVEQVEQIRDAYGSRVFHIHLEAPAKILEQRYRRRKGLGVSEFATYAEVNRNTTEQNIADLKITADVVIDTKRSTKDDVLVRAASALGLYGREHLRLVDVLVGGEYGSEGKGHITSYLAPEYDVLVRVGGPNAGHTVFRVPEPFKHYQLPSGTWFNESASLVIAPGAVLNVEKLLREIADCKISANRLLIDPQAMIIEKKDIQNERELVKNIGSTGQGVGFATARRITHRGNKSLRLAKDIPDLHPFVGETREYLEKIYSQGKKVLLEGTQGTGLSLYHGNYPHVTSRDTTVAGCLSDAGISPGRVRRTIMTIRSYPIRVQDPANSTSGRMSQEISWKEISRRSGISLKELNETERTTTTNRERRVSEFDWMLLRKAATLNDPTDVALTFADYLSIANRDARRFEQLTLETIRFIEEVERVANAPVSLVSTRFHSRSIIDRRAW